MKPLITSLFILFSFKVFCQPYVTGGNTRHRFAQLEVGVTQYISPQAGKTQVLQDGKVYDYQFNSNLTTAIFIGGTHFWGHADFALTIPIYSAGNGMRYGVDLQAKYYPWRIEKNKLRGYVGTAMSPFGFGQNDGPGISKVYFPLLFGLNYTKGNAQFELGVTYNYDTKFDYPISRELTGTAQIQPFIFGATYKYTLETTLNAEKNWLSGRTEQVTEILAKQGRLNGFSIGAGPTSSFRLATSEYLSTKYPFAGQHSYGVTLDYALGYYWHKPDLHVNVAYRNFKSNIGAYDYSQNAERKALTFELYKYLFDYKGFVPFVGPNISYENIGITETDGKAATLTSSFKGWKPGLTFGWDIRPDRLQKWTLRTSLRWYPDLEVTMTDGKKSNLGQLEFNFIQLVIYPQRFGF